MDPLEKPLQSSPPAKTEAAKPSEPAAKRQPDAVHDLDIDKEEFKFHDDDDIEKQLEELRKLEERQKTEAVAKSEAAKVKTPTTAQPAVIAKTAVEENKVPPNKGESPATSLTSPKEKDKPAKELDKTPDPDKDPYILPDNKKPDKAALVGLIESRDKVIQEKDTKIMKLRQMNDKLVKELKVLSTSLDKTLDKTRTKVKGPNPYTDASLKAREKELEAAQKQIKSYQKEIAALKSKLEAKTGYEKIIDLENKLKEGEQKNQELQKEIRALELIQRNQEKELEKITGNSEASNKIKALNEQLKATKDKNRELEKKIQAESASYQKQHNYLLDLQEKCQKLKKEKVMWKKAIAEKKMPQSEEDPETDKKSEEEILKASINSIQKRLDVERTTTKKTLDGLKVDISEYQRKIKEAEQEYKLNTAKLADLKKMMRHNQLKPLNDNNNADSNEVEAGELTEEKNIIDKEQ